MGGALVWAAGVRETASMLEPGEVQHALDLIRERSAKPVHMQEVQVTARDVTVIALDADSAGRMDAKGLLSHQQSWRVSHVTFFSGWREWDRVTGPETALADFTLPHVPLDLDAAVIRTISKLSQAVTDSIAADRDRVALYIRFFDPRWSVTVECPDYASVLLHFDKDGVALPDQTTTWAPPLATGARAAAPAGCVQPR